MSLSRAERRRLEREQDKKASRPQVIIPVPDEFLDCMSKPWRLVDEEGKLETQTLTQILVMTVRRARYINSEDSVRALAMIRQLQAADDSRIALPAGEYEWLMRVITQHAHEVWNGPDGALLREWLEDHHIREEPKAEKEAS